MSPCVASAGPFLTRGPPLRLSVQLFKPPKFAPWASLLGTDRPLQQHAARQLASGHDSHIIGGFASASTGCMPAEFELACPKCHHALNAIARSLYADHRATSMRCTICNHSSMNTKWLCPCGLPWITCSSCRGVGFRCYKPPSLKRRADQAPAPSLPPWLSTRMRNATSAASMRPLCRFLRKPACHDSGIASAPLARSSSAHDARWPRPEPATARMRRRRGNRTIKQRRNITPAPPRLSSISSNVVSMPACSSVPQFLCRML